MDVLPRIFLNLTHQFLCMNQNDIDLIVAAVGDVLFILFIFFIDQVLVVLHLIHIAVEELCSTKVFPSWHKERILHSIEVAVTLLQLLLPMERRCSSLSLSGLIL